MFSRTSLAVLALTIGLTAGFTLSRTRALSATAQGEGRVLVQGHGRAVSSVKPPVSERFSLTDPNNPRRSFDVVPAGKKFVLTDVMYIAQGSVRQDLTVNLANASPAVEKHSILFQVKLSPGESNQVHLCSGYVIPGGNALIAFTNAGLEPEQYVSVSVTGYLADE